MFIRHLGVLTETQAFAHFFCWIVFFLHISLYFNTNPLKDLALYHYCHGLLGGAGGKEPACQCKMQEMRAWSLGWEDPLEQEMAPDPSILAWKISRAEEPGGLQFMGPQRVGQDWVTFTIF